MTAPRAGRFRFARLCLWAGLLTGALPSAGRGELKIGEVRPTFGRLGSTRPTTRVLPGEDLHVTYVVSGVSKGADGRSEVSSAAELIDESGDPVAQVPLETRRIYLALGGDTLPVHAHFGLPLDFPPGKYRIRGVLTDVRTGDEVTAEQLFEVVPMEFGIVRLRLSGDPEGKMGIGGNLTVNQEVHVVGRGVGFTREGGRIHVVGNLTIRDGNGKPTVPVPIAFEIDEEIDDDLDQLDFRWTIPVNRPGRFSLLIEVRDELAGKQATYEMPLIVSSPPAPASDKPRRAAAPR